MPLKTIDLTTLPPDEWDDAVRHMIILAKGDPDTAHLVGYSAYPRDDSSELQVTYQFES